MTKWMLIKICTSLLALVWLGALLIAIGLQEAKAHPYQPVPNMVTPNTYLPPRT